MPQLTAARRLDIMSRALAYTEDHRTQATGSVDLTDLALELGEPEQDVRESLEPLRWVELEIPGDIVNLVDAIRLEDDRLIVEEAWWRRMATITPAEAARLYVKAAAAASLESEVAMPLRTAMMKLRRIVGEITVVEGDIPHVVNELRKARQANEQVIADIEGHDRTLVTAQSRFNVVAVFRDGNQWKVTLASAARNPELALDTGDAITLPATRVLSAIPVQSAESTGEPSPSVIDTDQNVEVTLEYPANRDWVLDPFETSGFTTIGEDRCRSTVRTWGTGELNTLLLRLGPGTDVVEPPAYRNTATEAATEILAIYDSYS